MGTQENLFALVQCSMLHPTNIRKKCVSHGFNFYLWDKNRGKTPKYMLILSLGHKQIFSNQCCCIVPGTKVREILFHVRKQQFSVVSQPKIRFLKGDSFLSDILGKTKKIFFFHTIPLFLNCLESVLGHRNVKSYFFIFFPTLAPKNISSPPHPQIKFWTKIFLTK